MKARWGLVYQPLPGESAARRCDSGLGYTEKVACEH
ncbi:hypothetical protein ABH924_001273 [Arthrobacter sp. GAS37]